MEENQKKKTKKEKRRERHDRIQMIFAWICAIFFVFNALTHANKDYKDSKLFYVIIGFTVVYILVFIIFLISHHKNKNKKKLEEETSNYKNILSIIKSLLNLLFIISSILILIDSFKNSNNIFLVSIKTIITSSLLLIRLLFTIFNLKKRIKSQIDNNK